MTLWNIGDRAVCICDDWLPSDRAHDAELSPIYVALAPRKGTVWTVAGVRKLKFNLGGDTYLSLEGQSSWPWFHSDCFRKIEPVQQEQDASDMAEVMA